MNRSIFHIRLKNFEVQAERLMDKQLRTRPLAIISSSSSNGTVVQLSDEAESEGLRVGMKVSLVRKMNHSVRLLNYNDRLYNSISWHVFKTVANYSPLVEPTHYGQYFIDMSGMHALYKDNKQAGGTILKTISGKVDIPGILGISANKLVSRICTMTIPEPIYEVGLGTEQKFIAPLASQVLPVTQEKQVARIVDFLMLRRVYDVQSVLRQREESLVMFGSYHHTLQSQAKGEDHSLVSPPQNKPHILKQKILDSATNDVDILQAVVQGLAGELGFDLRTRKEQPGSILLEIHYDDGFTSSARGKPLAQDDREIGGLCRRLFEKANHRRNRIRSVLLDAMDLKPVARQVSLFEDAKEKDYRISRAVDAVRSRFGVGSIGSAAALVA